MDNSSSSINLNETAKTYIKGTAITAGIAAIFGLVSSILKVILTFAGPQKRIATVGFEQYGTNTASYERTGSTAGAVIVLIISILLFYFLNKFANQTKAGLSANSSEVLGKGFGGLASYTITIGILLIICLAFLLLAIAVAGNKGA